MKRLLMLMTVAALASSCRSSNEGATSAAPVQFESGLLSLTSTDAADGGGQLKVRSGKDQSHLNVIIAQISYDHSRLILQGCNVSPGIGEGTQAQKQLLFLEQTPGSVRAVLTGSAEAVPSDTDLFTCDFTAAADAPAGAAKISLEAGVSDTDFVDHSFRGDVSVGGKKVMQ